MSEDLFSAGSNPYSPHSTKSPLSQVEWSDDQQVDWKPVSPLWAIVPRPREQRPMLSRLSVGIENWDLGQKYLHALMYPRWGQKVSIDRKAFVNLLLDANIQF